MGYGLIGLIILVLDIIAVVNVIQSGMAPTMKLVWVLLILALPVVGMVLYFAIGAKGTVQI